MTGNVLFLDSVHPSVWQELESLGHTCIDGHELEPAELGAHLQYAVGIIVRHRIYLGEELLSKAPMLKWVGRSGVGLDAIDTDYCQAKGIHVLNGEGGNADAVGEHVIGLLLSLLNHLGRADKEVRQGIWRREANRGRELGSFCLGIIGYGNTGRSLAEKLGGFGIRVLAYDKYRTVDGPYAVESTLTEIQEQCDIISFHVPLNEETEHYLDRDFINCMRHPFYLINASRGPICKLAAIAEGIRTGKIIGAGLDVLPKEPKDGGTIDLNDQELAYLLRSEQVIFSPHIAGWTEESYLKLAEALVDRIKGVSS